HHHIDRNLFADRVRPPDHMVLPPPVGRSLINGFASIRIGPSIGQETNARVTVERNLFENCWVGASLINNKSNENTYRYNTFRNSRGALTLRNGHRCHIEGNYFFQDASADSESGGVQLHGEDHVVVNNYFEGLRGTGLRSTLSISN